MGVTEPAWVVGAYLVGSIPFGLLIGLARGVDIRGHGSRNIGATNAGRVLGRKWGFLCLALDILKGLIPTLLAGRMLVSAAPDAAALLHWLLVALATILGHVFPIYLGFRGGKGVATTIGAALGVFPYYTIAIIGALVAYALGRFLTGFVSVGSLALAAAFPIAVAGFVKLDPNIDFDRGWPLIAGAILIALLIIVRHRENIARLLRGEEKRAGGTPAAVATPRESAAPAGK